MIRFRVDMLPVAKGRPRFAKRGAFVSTYTPPKTERAERDFIALADEHKPAAPLAGPVELVLRFFLAAPKAPAWKRAAAGAAVLFPRGPKDVDNLAKLVMDAFNRSGAWWNDDAQVVSLNVTKMYGRPGVEVSLREVEHVATAAAWKARQHVAPLASPGASGRSA